MELAKIKPGDYVEGVRLGVHFEARVIHKRKGVLDVEPSSPNITYRTLTARQVLHKLSDPGIGGAAVAAMPDVVKRAPARGAVDPDVGSPAGVGSGSGVRAPSGSTVGPGAVQGVLA